MTTAGSGPMCWKMCHAVELSRKWPGIRRRTPKQTAITLYSSSGGGSVLYFCFMRVRHPTKQRQVTASDCGGGRSDLPRSSHAKCSFRYVTARKVYTAEGAAKSYVPLDGFIFLCTKMFIWLKISCNQVCGCLLRPTAHSSLILPSSRGKV